MKQGEKIYKIILIVVVVVLFMILANFIPSFLSESKFIKKNEILSSPIEEMSFLQNDDKNNISLIRTVQDYFLNRVSVGNQIEISIKKELNGFATGLVVSKNNLDSIYNWYAYRKGEKWVVTAGGKEIPNCSRINPYGYPKEIIYSCSKANGQLMER